MGPGGLSTIKDEGSDSDQNSDFSDNPDDNKKKKDEKEKDKKETDKDKEPPKETASSEIIATLAKDGQAEAPK
jgi:hypothetical protein